jgi:putative Holliday junction resolvase
VIGNGAQGPDFARIAALVREWHPQALLVGLPLTMSGEEQRNSHAARAFATELSQRYSLPAHLVDERLSSHEAAQRFATRRASGQAKRKHAADLDAIAAEIIIENWFTHAADG